MQNKIKDVADDQKWKKDDYKKMYILCMAKNQKIFFLWKNFNKIKFIIIVKVHRCAMYIFDIVWSIRESYINNARLRDRKNVESSK